MKHWRQHAQLACMPTADIRKGARAHRGLLLLRLVTAGLLLASSVFAQLGTGGFGPGGPNQGPPSAAPPPKKKPGEPELHAAPGASDALVTAGNEPSLPKDPLEVPKLVLARLGSDAALDAPELGKTATTNRDFYGLFYKESSGDYQFQLTLPVPLWAERTQPSRTDSSVEDRASLFGGLYYNRRSAERADDILFPFFWNLKDRKTQERTTVIGPWVNRRAAHESDDWLAPLYFTGTRRNGDYTLIPPLLTWLDNDGDSGLNIIGPAFLLVDWRRSM